MILETILTSLRDCLSPEKFTTSEFRDNNRIIVVSDALYKTLECLKNRCGFDMLIDITAADEQSVLLMTDHPRDAAGTVADVGHTVRPRFQQHETE